MRALTVDCVMWRRLAAATKLPVAATARKVRASSVSIFQVSVLPILNTKIYRLMDILEFSKLGSSQEQGACHEPPSRTGQSDTRARQRGLFARSRQLEPGCCPIVGGRGRPGADARSLAGDRFHPCLVRRYRKRAGSAPGDPAPGRRRTG